MNNGKQGSNQLKVAALFAGVAGIERGLQKTGRFRTALLSESDSAAIAVLRERFPGVRLNRDVRKLGRLPRGTHLVTAGFPCQDLSPAGGAVGLNGKKSSLVSHVFRLLERDPVPWLLLENVPFMLHLNRGHAMEYVIESLERLGYKWAYRVIDTQAFGLPQRRQRLFILASLEADPSGVLFARSHPRPQTREHGGKPCGFYWTEGNRGLGWAVDSVPTLKAGSAVGIPSPPAIWMPDGRIVTPDIRDAERLQGFPRNWTRPAEQLRASYRWRLVGNAVTVDVAEWLGLQIAKDHYTYCGPGVQFESSHTWPQAAFGSSEARTAVQVSSWPVRRRGAGLAEYLRFPPKPLSHRAAHGFATRLARSRLRYPNEFFAALATHVRRTSE